jgi:hypothetical protein
MITLENWRLTLESWRLILEHQRLTFMSNRLTLVAQWLILESVSRESQPGVLEVQTEILENHVGAVEYLPGAAEP